MNKKIIWWILIAIWCAGIFYQSGKPGHESEQESMYIVKVINHLLGQVVGHEVVVVTDGMARKAAHFSEYLVLGGLLFRGYLNRFRLWRTALFSFGTGVLYAASDEFHQYFIPGRHMRLLDWSVDTTGIIIGLFIFLVFLNITGKSKADYLHNSA